MAVVATWDAADASGIHNVFRYAFNVPAGAFTNSPLLDIAIEGGSAVVKTPPAANTADFVLSVVESSDVAGAAVTRRKPLDAAGRTVFTMENAASRFYRLSAIANSPSAIPESGSGVQLWADGPYWSSTPSHYPREAWGLDLDSHGFRKGEYRRYNGIPVRPVRDAD